MSGKPTILHCHSTFAAGGKETRSAQLINAMGSAFAHHIVSGDATQMEARALIDRKRAEVGYPDRFPAMTGWPTPGRLVEIAQAIKGYDLVCTYNWGAIDVAMAHSVFGAALGLPPLIHHEDGFNEDEIGRLKRRRNWYRRAALRRAHALVVPSRTLERIARDAWGQPQERIHRIPNGIDTAAFARKPDPRALRLVKRKGEKWVGTLAGLRPVKQLEMLVEAAASLPEDWHLVILGEGPERDAIGQAALDRDIAHRVHLPGRVDAPQKVIGLFDIFALSSQSEQFPLSVVEAMAAGLPVAAPDIGDIRAMVAEPNRGYIAVPGDPQALSAILCELAASPDKRRELGQANQDRARECFDRAAMVAAYRALYQGALYQGALGADAG